MSDTDSDSVVKLHVHDEVQVCADFSMSHSIHGLTGSSDNGRCAQRSGSFVLEYLSPSCHLGTREDRSTEFMSQQWELSVLVQVAWSVLYSIDAHITYQDAEGILLCDDCEVQLLLNNGVGITSGIVRCTDVMCPGAGAPVFMYTTSARAPLPTPLTWRAPCVVACADTRSCAVCAAACSCRSYTAPGTCQRCSTTLRWRAFQRR